MKDLKIPVFCAGQLAQLVGALSHTPKGCVFDPQLGCVQEATDGSMFLSFSLSFSLPDFPQLPLSLKKNR